MRCVLNRVNRTFGCFGRRGGKWMGSEKWMMYSVDKFEERKRKRSERRLKMKEDGVDAMENVSDQVESIGQEKNASLRNVTENDRNDVIANDVIENDIVIEKGGMKFGDDVNGIPVRLEDSLNEEKDRNDVVTQSDFLQEKSMEPVLIKVGDKSFPMVPAETKDAYLQTLAKKTDQELAEMAMQTESMIKHPEVVPLFDQIFESDEEKRTLQIILTVFFMFLSSLGYIWVIRKYTLDLYGQFVDKPKIPITLKSGTADIYVHPFSDIYVCKEMVGLSNAEAFELMLDKARIIALGRTDLSVMEIWEAAIYDSGYYHDLLL